MKLLTLMIGDKSFGLPIGLIREILEDSQYTPVGKAPKDIVGLMNVRGQIVTVISPGICFGLKQVASSQKTKMIILKKNSDLSDTQKVEGGQDGTANDLYALEVDDVDEVNDVGIESLDPVPGNTPKEEAEFISSIARIDGGVLPIIHASRVINQELIQDEQSQY